MSMYDDLAEVIFDIEPCDREPRAYNGPAVVITNSVSTRIRGANEDIEVRLDDEGEFLIKQLNEYITIKQLNEYITMDRDEAEALFMVLGVMLNLDE